MDGRTYFLTRRHRLGILVGTGIGLVIGGTYLGMVIADFRTDNRFSQVSLGTGLLLLGVLFTSFVQRVRWLDSAVADPRVRPSESQQAV